MMNQTVSDAGDALIRVRRVREGTGERPGCGRRPGAPEEKEDEGPQRAQKMHVSNVRGGRPHLVVDGWEQVKYLEEIA